MKRQTEVFERSTVAGEEASAFIPFPPPPRETRHHPVLLAVVDTNEQGGAASR